GGAREHRRAGCRDRRAPARLLPARADRHAAELRAAAVPDHAGAFGAGVRPLFARAAAAAAHIERGTTGMSFGLIVVGDEIVSGKRQDRHFPRVVEMLRGRGLALAWAHFIGDDRAA